MKKILLTVVFILSSAVCVQAQEGADSQDPANKSVSTPAKEDQLIPIDQSADRNRIIELERRLNDLERSYRFLDDRLRSLDRSVDDLKRRRSF
ncbi:MAG: hypothetical protein HYZ83_01905 [Candidatus Omnitrophica bacterium]|nr:hypothetical protein [Candidatus Omnitrophota bacterium]